jgi:hypothetical protein
MMFYRLGNNNQTDQGNETEGLKMEVIRGGGVGEGGCEGIILCLSLTKETYTVGSQCHLQLHYRTTGI